MSATPTTVNIAAVAKVNPDKDEDYYTRPDFIYGGPFIPVILPSQFLDISTPRNVPLQGTFRKSFAYYSLKERLPVILTKVIDYLSREGQNIMSSTRAPQEDINKFMKSVAKLKNDLVTNKEYDLFTFKSPECEKWNRWIEALDNKKYFLNSWMFTECYVYRKLREGCELTEGPLEDFDYFEEQKKRAFKNNEEIMCVVADRVVEMVKPKEEKDKRKADFVTLLKLSLWANKCDLSLSMGSEVDLIKAAKDETERLRLNPPPPPPPPKGKKAKKQAAPAGPIIISSDPFQMIVDLKDKILADDCNKIADQVQKRAEKMQENITNAQQSGVFKAACSCNKVAKQAGLPICTAPEGEVPPEPAPASKQPGAAPAKPAPEEEIPKIPCPAKMTLPSAVFIDIITDNAGYELFTDLCLAHFLVGQKIVQKVRFHVKNMPWFISDVTINDFHYLIDACMSSQFSAPSSTGAMDPETNEPKVTTAENLRTLAEEWKKFVDDGIFIILAEDFWTYPQCYKEMKKIDPHLYRKLQTGVACIFKGDLNYRKLLGDINCNPSLGFQAAIGEFKPAPVIAVRTVKAETICGLGKGKFENASKINPKWMETGNYGVIQYAPKGEPLKVSTLPCIYYCTTCFGVICPEQFDI